MDGVRDDQSAAAAPAGWYPNPDDRTGRWLSYWSGEGWDGKVKPATKAEREVLSWPAADHRGAGSGKSEIEAGWYPESGHWMRYWDGGDWTDARRPSGTNNSLNHPMAGPAASGMQARLGSALHRVRVAGDTQALATFWLGIGSVTCFILAIPTKSAILVWGALLGGIAAIITARFVRDRARQSDDPELLYLSRWGQVLGWSVVGVFVAVMLIYAALLGSLLGSAAS